MSTIPPLSLVYFTSKSGSPRSEPLRHGLRIGSSAEWNDLVLPFSGVNPVHAEIREIEDGSFEVLAMGSSIVQVDGETVKRERLRPGSSLVIGTVDARVGVPVSTGRAVTSLSGVTSSGGSSGFVRVVAIAAVSAAFSGGAVFFALTRGKNVKPEKTPSPASDSALLHLPAPAPVPASGDPLEAAKKAVVTVIGKLSFEPGYSTGTGFFVMSSGRLVTNLHVVKK